MCGWGLGIVPGKHSHFAKHTNARAFLYAPGALTIIIFDGYNLSK